MSLFRRPEDAVRSGGWTPEPVIPPFPGTSVGGGSAPSMDSALRSAAVWACVQLVADTISMMPLNACVRDSGGLFRPVASGNPTWLETPDGVSTLPDWLYMMIVSLMLRGMSPGEITVRDSMQRPTQIVWQHPDQIAIKPDDYGRLGFAVRGKNPHVVTPANSFIPMGIRMAGSPVGLSPIKYAAATLSTDAAVQRFALGYYTEALHPAATLTSDQAIGQDDARALKERIMEHVGSREPLVLGGGVKLTPIAISADESQFLNTQKWSTATIARVFRVPPEMIGAEAGNSMTYSNVEQRAIDFLTYTIQPWLTRIEAAMSTLLPRGQFFRFDPSVLLRTDLETTLRATAIGIASRQMAPDEARAMRDMPPLTTEQKKLLDLVPLTVAPTGRPSTLAPGAPGPVTFYDDEDENDNNPDGGASNGPSK